MHIAYVCNRYPAVSLSFIQREVRALRELGMSIDTFAIRRALRTHLLTSSDHEEFGSTYAVLPPHPGKLLFAHLATFFRHPRRYIATLMLALRLRPRGLRGMVWQCFYFAEAVAVWRACDRRGIRHLHAQFANVANDVALLASHLGGSDRGWSWSFALHGPVEFFDVTQSRLAEKLSRASFVVCISDFARSQAMAFLDYEQWGKLHVVHCGIDVNKFRPVAGAPRKDHSVHLLNVGRLVELKGHATLLDALARVRAVGVDARLQIIGDGPNRAALESLASQLGVDAATTFAGAIGQDEIPAFYEAADLFCLASFAEGIPSVLMEAMASEIPVVATRIAGIPELVEHGVTGLVVSPGRPDELAEALAGLCADAQQRAAMGRAAREKVVADFELRRSARALQHIFADALMPHEGSPHRSLTVSAPATVASQPARTASRSLVQ